MYSKETIAGSRCTAEVGTKIYAYFNLVLISVSTLASLIIMLYSLIVGLFLPLAHKQPMDNNMPVDPEMIIVAAISFAVLIVSAKSLIFAVLLFCGVQKKKPEYIKAYFIFGVVVVVLCLMSVIVILCGVSQFGYGPIIFVLPVSIFSLILVMIRKTYKKYEMMHKQFENKLLNEKV